MKLDRTRLIVAFLLVALVFSLLTLIFWGFVRDIIIVPIYYSLWLIGLLINSLPQEVYLVALLLISAFISFNTLFRLQIRRDRVDTSYLRTPTETRYSYWKRLTTNLYLSRFSKNLFAAEARKLILTILAHEYRLETSEIEAMIHREQIPVPETIRRLIEEGEFQVVAPPTDRLSQILRWLPLITPPREPQLDARMDEIITFIEQHLEIMYVGDTPESRS